MEGTGFGMSREKQVAILLGFLFGFMLLVVLYVWLS